MPLRPTNSASRRAQARSLLRANEDLWVAPLLAFQPLARELGIDPVDLLMRHGVDPDAFADPVNRLPFDVVGRLAEACARESRCEHFGLMVGSRSGIASAGIAGELARHSETVHSGLRVLITHLHLYDRGAVLALSTHDATRVAISYRVHHPGTPGTVQIVDAAMAILMAIMRSLCGPDWLPTEVTLARARPRNLEPYRAVFRVPIRFDSPHSALIFPARFLQRRITHADPVHRARLARLVNQLEARRHSTVSEQVIDSLSRMLVAMPPTAARVARAVTMSDRTLRRRLVAEGTTFRRLLEEVRLELARQLLEDTRMPVADVAATLHYRAPAAFTRAFKSWTGKTALQVRKATGRTSPS